jgi:hypothetical protein
MTRREFVALAALAKRGAGRIAIESDGMISVAGRRRFWLGLYQLPRIPDAWRAAADAGFHVVRVSPAELPEARRHGLYGWIALGSIRPGREAEDEARIRKIVEQAKHDPALLFWETEDEPTFVWKKPGELRIPPEQLIRTRRFVEKLDREHPFYLNHSPTNLESTLRKYNEAADIVATDIYPVIPHGIRELYALWPDGRQGDLLNTYISQVGQYADKMRRVAGPGRAVFMVLQAFAWENLREKDRDPRMVLYPTRDQTRFMAYQCAVHGVNGILYWGLEYTPADAPVWSDLERVGSEFRELASELAERPLKMALKLEYHDTGHSLDRGIEWILKPSRGGAVLIAVNADCNPVEVTFRGLERFREARELFTRCAETVRTQELRARFEPFGVRIWRLGPQTRSW